MATVRASIAEAIGVSGGKIEELTARLADATEAASAEIDAAKAKGIYKGRPVTRSIAHASCRCARKEWASLRSLRPSDANAGTCTRRSRLQG
jgi:hypothetical protein